LFDENNALSRAFLIARKSCCDSGCRNCPYGQSDTQRNPSCIQQKTCERCGAGFECCREGCWCKSASLNAATLASLREQYGDCLCPTCLAALSAA
jgi:hypothetical protein